MRICVKIFYDEKLSTKLGAMSQINPRFGTNTLHSLQGHSTYPLSDISFKKTYCPPLFKLLPQKCPLLACALAYCF